MYPLEGDEGVNRHPFDLLVQLDTRHIRLDCAALHLARDIFPRIEVASYLRQLDNLAEEVAARRPGLAAIARYRALRDVLVGLHGFRGNDQDYYDPQNSYFNRVLDRQLGVPVTLSALWIEVARRLKWPVGGIALPGHFLVRIDDPERFVLADPFNEGQSLSVDDCIHLVAEHIERPMRFSRKMLKPLGTRAILSRILLNLRGIYLAEGAWHNLATVLRRLAALEPRNGRHFQDLAAVSTRLGDVRGAYGFLRVYLDRAPQATDRELVRGNLKRLEAAIVAMN
jgi:regulator of sirC expression with transglutaminase-like and TPR domain